MGKSKKQQEAKRIDAIYAQPTIIPLTSKTYLWRNIPSRLTYSFVILTLMS